MIAANISHDIRRHVPLFLVKVLFGIHQSFPLLLWNPPVFPFVAMESTSLFLCCYGFHQSFPLLLWNPPVFSSVAIESTSLSLCCYALAFGPNMADALQAFCTDFLVVVFFCDSLFDLSYPGDLHPSDLHPGTLYSHPHVGITFSTRKMCDVARSNL